MPQPMPLVSSALTPPGALGQGAFGQGAPGVPYDVTALYWRVLVPVDFSEWSRLALLTAADMQRRFGSEVVLLTITGFGANDEFLTATGGAWTPTDLIVAAREHLELFQREVDPSMRVVYEARMADDVDDVVLSAIRRWKATLVLLGLQLPKRRPLVRSVAERITRDAPCAVFVLPTELPAPPPPFA